MMTTLLPTLFMMLAFGAYFVFAMNKRKAALANVGPAMQMFFERTQYRYAEIAQQPMEAQVALCMSKMQDMMKGTRAFEQHLVRDFYGMPVHHTSYTGPARDGSNAYSMSCDWRIPFQQQPRILFQIADASLDSTMKAVREAFSNTTRIWSPAYPNRVMTGDPVIDNRFVIYAVDPNAARHVLATTQGLKELLLSCAEVDMCVTPSQVIFSDPTQKNMTAAMGGTVGQMAIGLDYGKTFELTIPVHERLAQILAMVARASQ